MKIKTYDEDGQTIVEVHYPQAYVSNTRIRGYGINEQSAWKDLAKNLAGCYLEAEREWDKAYKVVENIKLLADDL